MASILTAALPFLAQMGGGSAGGLSGLGGLANILGGGNPGLGTVAGSTLGGGMQGPTQGSGLFGALSGGNFGSLFSAPQATQASAWQNPGVVNPLQPAAQSSAYTPPKWQNLTDPSLNKRA